MGATVGLDANAGLVTVEGVVTVTSAADIRSALIACLAAAPAVTVDVGGIERADISLIQVLIAAARSARELDKPFELKGQLGAVRAAAGGSEDLDVLLGILAGAR